jgi:hypothetical protein
MEGDLLLSWPPRHAAATRSAQLPQTRAAPARRLGTGVLCAGIATLAVITVCRLLEKPRETAPEAQDEPEYVGAARYLNGGAAILSFSVLADSALEHYRGAYHNPAMYLAPTVAAATLVNSLHMTLKPEHFGTYRTALAGLGLATGIGGLGFHLYNVAKREGSFDLVNLFYGAPLGAPIAMTLAGLAGLAGSDLVREGERRQSATLLELPAGKAIGAGAAVGLIGTVAEAALLHFRGAFHNPFMFLPVTLPPIAAITLGMATLRPGLRRLARALLRATAVMGVAGTGFHIYGVSRNMGGFYNWSQNLLNGPPLPAPPSFSGVALAGLAGLKLMDTA